MRFNIIVGMCINGGIGINGKLPWHFKKDMNFFQKITTGVGDNKNAVIMGRKTWDSIPFNYKPLKNRDNIILTRIQDNKKYPRPQIKDEIKDNMYFFPDIENVYNFCNKKNYQDVWFIGGEEIYKNLIPVINSKIHNIYITMIHKDYNCDTFFPIKNNIWSKNFVQEIMNIENENNIKLTFMKHTNKFLEK